MENNQAVSYLSFAVYFIGTIVMIALMLGLSYVLGQRQTGHETNTPFESGIMVTGSARLRFAIKFYLVAIFFVVFDLEAIFLFAWAIAARESGWRGFAEVAFFTAILFAALVYIWRTGGLSFGTRWYHRSSTQHREIIRDGVHSENL